MNFIATVYTRLFQLLAVPTIALAERIYGREELAETLGSRFKAVLGKAHQKTGMRAVVLIDEYDKPLLDVMDMDISVQNKYGKMTLEDYNRNLLKGVYSVFKEADDDLQFVLLTGVTKFSQVSVFSGFNQPNDISMDEHYEALCGITEEELYSTFDEQIKAMAVRYKTTEEGMKYKLKRKFDGYHFSPNMLEFEDVYIVLGLNHTIYSTFALVLFDEDRETADHSQYEIEGVLEITFLLALIVLTTLVIRNAGKEGSHQILQLMAIALRHHIYYLNNPGIR
jgi:hypothetical protein